MTELDTLDTAISTAPDHETRARTIAELAAALEEDSEVTPQFDAGTLSMRTGDDEDEDEEEDEEEVEVEDDDDEDDDELDEAEEDDMEADHANPEDSDILGMDGEETTPTTDEPQRDA